MNSASTDRRSAIESALLDYRRSPGRYALAQRQPQVLFASVKEVLQLASGRSPDGDPGTGSPAPVRQAACFFIRSALLNPDADHYTVLGVPNDADAATLKERYRLMMRLMHPDFADARAGPVWPADAATRVNQAYEVLSSPSQRRSYDEQLEPRPQAARAVGATRRTAGGNLATVPRAVAPAKPAAEDPRRRLKQLAAAFGAAGGFAMLAAWFAGGQSERETLVQRASTPSPGTALPQAVMSAMLSSPVVLPPSKSDLPALPAVRPALPEPSTAAPPLPTEPRPVLAAPAAPLPVTQARAVVESTPPIAAQASLPAAMPVAMGAAPAVAAPPAVQPPSSPPPPPPQVVASARPSPTLADVHSLLSKLLQEMESGWGDRLLSQLDREAQSEPGAQALLRRYNSVVDGMRPVRLSNVQFKAEPRDGRLLVTGRVLIQVRDTSVPLRELAMQAEFASRDGAFVMTRLAQAQE